MAEEPVEIPTPVDEPAKQPVKLKAGHLTSEYQQAQNNGWWAKLMVILGVLTNVGGIVMTSLQNLQATNPDVASNKSFAATMLIIGTVMAVAGAVQKALTDSAYIQGRSLVKAAAARDATPPPEV
jgi:hypothetical protein